MIEQAASADAPWNVFHRRWVRLQPPLRPHRDVCDVVRLLTADYAGRTMLLGVTPELAIVAQRTIAVEWSRASLDRIWPGNDAARSAVQGNWLNLPFRRGSFVAAIGDGSLNCLDYPDGYRRAFRELTRVIRPGGRIVVRLYVTPEHAESLSDIRSEAIGAQVGNMDALKWRLAHALCAARQEVNLPVRAIWAA